MKFILLSCFTLCFVLIFTKPAYAYIDPGTGSLILQGILAVIAGSATAVKIYWFKIKSFISRHKNKPPED